MNDNDNNHAREESRIELDRQDLPLLRHYLQGITWQERPLIEQVNPDRYSCLFVTHNPLEVWAAAGIGYAMGSLYNRSGSHDQESREALRNMARERDRLETEAINNH